MRPPEGKASAYGFQRSLDLSWGYPIRACLPSVLVHRSFHSFADERGDALESFLSLGSPDYQIVLRWSHMLRGLVHTPCVLAGNIAR